jgi:arylsulfatase A-like enzyme
MPDSSDRRNWRPALLAVACLLYVSAGLAAEAAGAPNVVVILADDLGWNDVGYHGSEIRTPNLDALAAAGVTLGQFHSQPTCTPTRAALMTGKSPQRLGIYRQFAKNAANGLPTGEATIADHFRNAGYQTWLVGKWHLGHARQEFHPNARGFDHFYGHVTGGIGYWDHVHGGGLDWQRNGTTLREAGYSTHLLAEEASALIEARDASRPFFLYASFNAPHLPNEAPDEAVAAYAAIESENRRIHAAMVSELDAAIGNLVATLRQAGELENTLIWFMSDNGGLNRDAGLGGFLTLAETLQDWFGAPLPITMLEFIRTNALDGGSDNTPLRFGKGSVYEGGVRVPSLVFWSGQLEAHHTDSMMTVQDVLPTVLAASGLESPDDLDGQNQWPVLTRKEPGTPGDYVTIGQNGAQAYYQWPWKLIVEEDNRRLYNLETDPLEATDLATKHPQRVDALKQSLQAVARSESLHIPLYKVMWDPDFFGGEEDRPPWADLIQTDPGGEPASSR